MRKSRSGLLGTSGGAAALGGSRQGAPAPAALAAAAFAGSRGLDIITAENPVYSPDDSLARAASKLQSIKALQPRAPARAAAAQAALAAAAPAAGGGSQPEASPVPPPERCESPHLIPAVAAPAGAEQQAPAPAGEGSHKALRCGGRAWAGGLMCGWLDAVLFQPVLLQPLYGRAPRHMPSKCCCQAAAAAATPSPSPLPQRRGQRRAGRAVGAAEAAQEPGARHRRQAAVWGVV